MQERYHELFFIPGIPQPKGSPRVIKMGPRYALSIKTTGKGEAWEQAVIAEAHKHAPEMPLVGPVRVTMQFALPRPKTVRRPMPSTKPDLDKLVRAVLDGLARAKIYKDDSRVVSLSASKVYSAEGHEGCLVSVYTLVHWKMLGGLG